MKPFQLLLHRSYTRYILLAAVFNLILAPMVQAATNNAISREQSFAIGLLLLGTIALAIYLFVVIFQPERF